MRGVISDAEDEVQNYHKDGVPDSFRVQYLKQIEGNVDTLRKLDNLLRASGHAILPPSLPVVPPSLIVVAYAQSQSPYYTTQKGSAIASSKTAGYEFAKYQALETIARRLNSPEPQLNVVIQYLERFAQPGTPECYAFSIIIGHDRPDLWECTLEVTLNSAYVNPTTMQRLGGLSASPEAEVRGQATIPPAPLRNSTVLRLRAGKDLGKKASFEFQLVPRPQVCCGDVPVHADAEWAV